jgi:hypothetical protein
LEKGDPAEGSDTNAARRNPRQEDRAAHSRFGDNPFDEPSARSSSTSSWIVAGLKVVAGLFATMTLIPVISRYGPSEIHSAEDGSLS